MSCGPRLRTTKAARNRVEPMIARGLDHQRIADQLGITVAQVDRVRAGMDAALAEDVPR